MKNKNNLIFLILFVFVIIISVLSSIFADSLAVSVISTVSTLIGIVGLLFSFCLDRNISEASFLLNLYNTFHNNDKISAIGEKLEKRFLNQEVEITEDDRSNIVEYLTFFEVLAGMELRGVISINCFDSLFGYDFFIAVNNEKVREIELDTYADYYTSLLKLKVKWEKYRKRYKLPIPLQK